MTADIVPQDFYVYAHYKATTGEIFYVGKGRGNRFKSKNGRPAFWQKTVAAHGLVIKIIQDGLQEWAAFELEHELIAYHGRRDIGEGPLVNLVDGGASGGGVSGWVPSKVTRARMSAAAKGVAKPTRRAVCCNNGMEFVSSKAAAEWVASLGVSNYAQGNISLCCSGKLCFAYGYRWWWKDAPPLLSDEEVRAQKETRIAEANARRRKPERPKLTKEEVSARHSEVMRKKFEDPGYMQAHLERMRQLSPEVRKKNAANLLAVLKRGAEHHNSRAVVQKETGTVFESSLAAAETLLKEGQSKNSIGRNIRSACSGQRKSAYGYTWSYATMQTAG